MFDITRNSLIILACFIKGIFLTDASNWEDGTKLSTELIPSKKHVTFKEEINVTCKVESSLEPNITWYRDYHKFNDQDLRSHVLPLRVEEHPTSGDRTYYSVLIVTVHRNTTFACEAENPFGISRHRVFIIVGIRPSLKLEAIPKEAQPRGHNASLHCSFHSITQASVSWFYEDSSLEELENESGIQRLSTEILHGFETRMTREYNYISLLNLHPIRYNRSYICRVKNLFGEVERSLSISYVSVTLNQGCEVDLDCSPLNSLCRNKKCLCPEKSPVYIEDLDECLPAVKFRKLCVHSSQCLAQDRHSVCSRHKMTCQCLDTYVYSMSKRHCLEAITEKGFTSVMTGIGCGLFVIVSATLALYFLRKKWDLAKVKKNVTTKPETKVEYAL